MIVLARRQQITAEELRQHAPVGSGRLHAYVVAHEGEAQPYAPSRGGGVTIRLGALAVRAVHAAIRRGLEIFKGHNQSGRKRIGEVVSAFVRDVAGRLSCVILCKMSEDVPAVSMEANIHVDESGNVTDVQSV